jgi:hypothetical protein
MEVASKPKIPDACMVSFYYKNKRQVLCRGTVVAGHLAVNPKWHWESNCHSEPMGRFEQKGSKALFGPSELAEPAMSAGTEANIAERARGLQGC